MLVDVLKPERDLSHAPLCQIVMALQNFERDRFELPGLDVEAVEAQTTSLDVDLHLTLVESDQGLELRWAYADSLFESATIERLAESFSVLLQGIAATPECKVGELPLLPPSDRAALRSLGSARSRVAGWRPLRQSWLRNRSND